MTSSHLGTTARERYPLCQSKATFPSVQEIFLTQEQERSCAATTVAELKKALKDRGLSVTGSKSELLERLTENLTTDSADAVLEDNVNLSSPKKTETEEPPQDEKVEDTEKTEPAEVEASEPSEEKPAAPKVAITTSLSEDEKIKKRAERFGLVNEDAKKLARAERFGVSATSGSPGANVDMLKRRAERFGQVTSSTLSKEDEAEKIRKRKDRFGDVTSSTNNTPAKFQKITFNSTSPAEDDKKKARAARFGLT